ncbi:TetR/AcrR family transcriptional regulator [uncultured Psychroserpens sp.]|uniref:TetR/AcrR family transcriptional regulator n=1 Tax=uncultured Psychroserpens sp. TaxID=255436 RepID=UPI00260D6B52|nr:TetR/AcrR family transcriptional regulator [uncultured Psychroserpens sp.]
MRPQKVQDEQMLNGLMSVMRSKGYDGASLKELSEATGLKKASLYHRFEGGKKDMASAVLAYLESMVKRSIYKVLVDENISHSERLDTVLSSINDMYNGGLETCMYRSLSLDSGISLFGDQIKQGIDLWINGFISFGVDKGMSKKEATQKANQTFIDIQGSLVMSKSIGSTQPFMNILDNIRNRYH